MYWVFFVFLALSGCNPIVEQHGWVLDKEKIAQLKSGMSEEQVAELMGPPSYTGFHAGTRWYYIYRVTEFTTTLLAPETKAQVVYELAFSDEGRLRTWQEIDPSAVLKVDVVTETTPVRGTGQKNVFQRVLKNVGRISLPT